MEPSKNWKGEKAESGLQPPKGTQPPDTLVLAHRPGANADRQNYEVLGVYFTKIVIIHPTDHKKMNALTYI